MNTMIPHLDQQACIFDLDGTLLDSKKGFERSLRLSLQAHGWEVGDVDLAKMIGPPIRKILEKATPGLPKELLEKVVQKFRETFDSTGCVDAELYPDVTRVLSRLAEAKMGMFLATNKPKPATDRVLRHFQLEPFFSGVFCPNAGFQRAPTKGELVHQAVLQAGLEPRRVMVIGDTREDFEAAQAVGCQFVAALYGYGNLGLRKGEFPLFLDKLRDLLKVLVLT